MTPFAQRILNDSMLPVARRQFQYNGCGHPHIPRDLLSAQVFELTAVSELIPQLGLKMFTEKSKPTVITGLHETNYAFLPAPTTWIEYCLPNDEDDPPPRGSKQRFGWLLNEVRELRMATMQLCWTRTDPTDGYDYMGVICESVIPLQHCDILGQLHWNRPLEACRSWFSDERAQTLTMDVYPMLALINTPRVIGRRQHMPHVGLERKLGRARGMVGRFPLQAWNEIILEVANPRFDGEDHETHLTGHKALHFCRAHLRIRFGQLEFVQSHWRGDPAIGMKRSRYILRPGRMGRVA